MNRRTMLTASAAFAAPFIFGCASLRTSDTPLPTLTAVPAEPPTPTAVPSSPTAQVVATTAPVPTETFTALAATATPTSAPAVAATPTVVAQPLAGIVLWRDQTLRNDGLSIAATGLPAPEQGKVYGGWLVGGGRNLFLGKLAAGSTSALTVAYASPAHVNLLANWDQVSITEDSAADSAPTIGNAVLSGTLPAQALVHIRHLLVSFAGTPDKIGFALGLRQEAGVLLQHAQFLKDGFDQESLPLQRLHAEHIVNIVEGAKGQHFGDLAGLGHIENPGDGFGILENDPQSGYIQGMIDHAGFASQAPDATDLIKLHASHVQICGENTRVRVTEIRDHALKIFQARSAADPREDVLRILALAEQTVSGVDVNGDGQILPIPGGGGVLTAYAHAQLMASIQLQSAGASVVTNLPIQPQPTLSIAPTATVVAAPTVAPSPTVAQVATQPPAGGKVGITIADILFNPNQIVVSVGTTIIWSHLGKLPHTVTADDNSFRSDTLNNGSSFQVTLSKAGTYRYYCEFHGGPGGAGMSGVIQVH